MKIGLQVNRFDWSGSPANTGSKLLEIARTADEAGFASLWVMDHYFQIEPMLGTYDSPMLEAYSTLAFMAAATQRICLGTMVTGVVYRHPGFLVKTVNSLDVLSGGRAMLGIGAAWYEREARGLGFPFPPPKERLDRLEETLQIALHMWSGDVSPYLGKYYQLHEPVSSPQPLSKPHPPILIGGSGEKRTLRLVAQYADACNLFGRVSRTDNIHKLDVLKRHCETVGRPYEEIERTVLYHLSGEVKPAELIAICQSLAEIGIQQVIFSHAQVHEIKPLEMIGSDVIPEVAEL